MQIDSRVVLRIFYKMLKARLFEEEASKLKESGLIKDELCLSLGQEATAGAVCALNADDIVFASHRNFAVATALDVNITLLLAELTGLKSGLCSGKSGAQSYADNTVNFYGASALYASYFNKAVGAALSLKLQNRDNLVIVFAGDGAACMGDFYEALNTAALLKLPVIFFIENNGYAKSVKTEKIHNVKDIAQRASGFEIPGFIADGNDALNVYETIKRAAEYAKKDGPIIIESKTYRLAGYNYNDEQEYKKEDETAQWRDYDPIKNITDYMLHSSMGTVEDLLMMRKKIEQEIYAAHEFVMGLINSSDGDKEA